MGSVHFFLDGGIPLPSTEQSTHIPSMKIKTPSNKRGFTLIELLVVISIIAIIAGFAFPAFAAFLQKARQTDQMNAGKQIFNAMANYGSESSHYGLLPAYTDVDDPTNTKVTSSNAAFQILLDGGYIDTKTAFINRASEWCKPPQTNTDATAKLVREKESDWCYVVGTGDTSSSTWPVLANAFAPGTTSNPTYVTDTGKKGGVWKGTKAVVIYRGGNGEVTETKTTDKTTYFIKRSDQPTKNAFVKDGDWLSGTEIEVLYPIGK